MEDSSASIDENVYPETPIDEMGYDETSTPLAKQPLSSKNAMEFLLTGTLQSKVCRYCLNVTSQLLELDTVLQMGGQTALYEVTVRDMVASFYPFQVTIDRNLPNKICEHCLNSTLRAYLFTQQCERSDRALRNYLEDVTEKVNKLDPIERKVKRGRQKLNPNPDKIYVAHDNVIDYAEPLIHLVNQGSSLVTSKDSTANDLACSKCWQVLPNIESRLNHEKIHPKSMWFHCHQCGRAFAKHIHLKKHVKSAHNNNIDDKVIPVANAFECKTCGDTSENYQDHLQHIEKHKFKSVLQQVLMEKSDKLCTVCLDKSPKMVDLETRMSLNGSCPELNGDKSLYHIVGSTLPDMNYFYSYMGTKICQNCSDKAITTYLFINQTLYTRRRLDTCITTMLKTIEEHINLTKTEEPNENMFIELSQSLVVPIIEVELTIDDLFDDAFDESQLKVEVLEDKYRIASSSESESEDFKPVDDFQRLKDEQSENALDIYLNTIINVDIASKKGDTSNCKEQLQNGFCTDSDKNDFHNVSEFLTFKKKKEPTRASKKTSHICDLCSKRFISVYFLKKHLLKHINKKAECKICDFAFFKSKFLRHEHSKMAHSLYVSNYSTCETCGRTFTDSAKMQKHQKRHSKLQCSLCDKVFRSQKHYDIHVQRHIVKFTISNRKASQTCSFCESECLSKNKLSIHVNKVHLQIKPYSCDMCERKFYTKYNLANHKKLHDMRSNEKCEFCGLTLKCRRDLVIHVRKHMGSKPLSCMMCTEAFYSQSDKNTHMKEMHGGRIICNICRIVFEDKSELKLHIRTVHVSQF